MVNRKSIQSHHGIIALTLVSLSLVEAQQQATNSTEGSCTPSGCQAICAPACNNDQICSLRVMTACGVCPASTCASRSVLGLPPLPSTTPSSSTSDQSSSSSSSSNGGLIGGIVGGLVGLGIILGLGVYCYIKKSRKRGKLPFAFTNGSLRSANGAGIMSQERFGASHLSSPPPTPNPAVVAALTMQQQQQFIGMTELASPSSISSIQQRSVLSSPLTRTSTVEELSLPAIQQQRNINTVTTANNDNNNNNNNNTLLTRSNSINTPLYNNMDTPSSSSNSSNTISTPGTVASVPEEFQEKIALQNKRISQILNNNPRLSQYTPRNSSIYSAQQQQQQQQQQGGGYDRNSGISFTTDDDSEFGDEENQQGSVTQVAQLIRAPTHHYQAQLAPTSPMVQKATRAKAQIMRVNSVKRSSGVGLSRNDSVRTVLTAVSSPQKTPPMNEEEQKELDATPSIRTEGVTLEDPFIDTPQNTTSASASSSA